MKPTLDPSFGRESSQARGNSPLVYRRKQSKNIIFSSAWKITLSFCIIVVIVTHFSPGIFFRILNPIAKPFWNIRESAMNVITNKFSFFKTTSSLVEENNYLKQKLLEANIKAADYDLVSSENKVFQSQFGTTSKNVIIGKIITRPFESPFDIVVVDTGNHLTKVGNRVLGPSNIGLGEVIEVSSGVAKVRLYSSPSVETQTEVSRTSAPLVLIGRGGGNFTVTVPRDFNILVGDILTIPAAKSNFVARVGSIEETEADSFKTVLLSTPLNIFQLSWVLISQ